MLYEICNIAKFGGYLESSYPEEKRVDVKVVKEDSHIKRKKEDKVVIQKTVCLSHLNFTEKGIFWHHRVATFWVTPERFVLHMPL